MRLNLKIDGKLHFSAHFRPAHGKNRLAGREFEATFAAARGRDEVRLAREKDGSLALATGSKGAPEVAASPRFAIPGGSAELVREEDGFSLCAEGDVPLTLRQKGDDVELVVGDRTSTLIRERLRRRLQRPARQPA